MAWTHSEIEAKLAALEDRITFLFQNTDSLELRFEQWTEMWESWAVELQTALAGVEKQISRIRNAPPPSPPDDN